MFEININVYSDNYYSNIYIRGGSKGGGSVPGAPPPPKIGKKYDVLSKNRDFSHEIPQQFSRPPALGAIF